MTKKVKKAEAVVEKSSETALFAIVLELDHIITHTRKIAFEVLQSILKEKKYEVTSIDFSRFCLSSKPEFYLEELLPQLGAKKLSLPKLAEDVHSGIAMYLSSNKVAIQPGIEKLLETVKRKNLLLGVLTALPEDLYKNVLKKAGIDEAEIKIFSFSDIDKNFPRADVWLKIVKDIDLPARNCTVFAASSSSCKAALTAGMRCVAIPDEFTRFQDFGGCHVLADSLKEIDMKKLFLFAEN